MPLIRKTLHTSVVRSAIQTSMEEVFWKKKKEHFQLIGGLKLLFYL